MNTALAQKVERDLRLVEHARVIIQLSADDSELVTIQQNPRSPLDLIVIRGPAEIKGQRFSNALLLEIGTGRHKPYRRIYTPNRPSPLLEPKGRAKLQPLRQNFPRRLKPAGITAEQYRLVAPFLFAQIQQITDETVAGWNSPFFTYRRPRSYTRSRKKNLKAPVQLICDRGKMFHVDRRDRSVLGDMLWCSVHNRRTKTYLRNRAGKIAVQLRSTNGRLLKRKDYADTALFKRITDQLESSSFAPWQRAAILNAIKQWPNTRVWRELWEHVGAEDDLLALELIKAASRKESPLHRIGRLHLRPHWSPKERPHYTFEVFSTESSG